MAVAMPHSHGRRWLHTPHAFSCCGFRNNNFVPLWRKYVAPEIDKRRKDERICQPQHSFRDSDCPLLQTIGFPSDLRKLPQERLPQVCDELRKCIIANLSSNPGHFASSMGAVEITVALHYVFNTPEDHIVWDVGHQSYAHKILTGRREAFASLRKLGGLSGFPNPNESEYDTFVAGMPQIPFLPLWEWPLQTVRLRDMSIVRLWQS